ncbi:MAG: DnaA N-terminal domain-containing protein [Verrucomicrobiota bacterium]
MSPKQSYNGHGTKEFPITPFRGTKTSAEANSEASQGIPQADPNAEGVSQNSFFPEAQSGANVEVEILPPPPPFEAANAVKENANFVRSALSDGEEVQKSSTVRTCEPSTRSESVPSGTASEKKDYSTGKEDFQVNGTDLVLRLNRLFGRPERATFESDEQRILKGSKCPSFWNSDLCNLEKWIQLPSTYRTYFPKSLKRLLNQWGKSCDWARHNIAEFEQIQSSKSDSKNSKTVIVTPLAYLESIPHLMPDSQTEAESEFQVFIENLARTISKSSVDRWLSKATPIGLRVDDNALVLKAENQFSASFIMENYKTQIIHAAGSRKVVICI